MMAMLNCRDPLFGGGSNPNTMAGASRLADDGPYTSVMSLIKSKLGLSSRSSGNGVRSSLASHEQYSLNRVCFSLLFVLHFFSRHHYIDFPGRENHGS